MAVRLGLGIDYYLTEQVGLNFGPTYVLPLGAGGDLTDLQYLLLGVGAFLRLGE